MKPSISVANRKQTASFRIVVLMLAIAPLWLMLVAANTSANAATMADTPDPHLANNMATVSIKVQ